MLKNQHFIAGKWVGDSAAQFSNMPVSGEADQFSAATTADVDAAAKAAEACFNAFANTSRAARAKFLRAIAEEIDARANDITQMGIKETGLPEGRLVGERGRTTGQLRLFADHIEKGDYLDIRHDPALPERTPLPRADLKLMQRPVGPVVIFGASNFPLAFSVAGGDTASALAAGCPVIVRGHVAHPGLSDLVAQAIGAAAASSDMPDGVFSLLQGGDLSVGAALVQHPLVKAVGFTGSLGGGRALFDLCAARKEPIPFFGELGSINPIFLLPNTLKARAGEIAAGWAGSLTMGAGQFCTNPGLVIAHKGASLDAFCAAARDELANAAQQTMLTPGIAANFERGRSELANSTGVEELVHIDGAARCAAAAVYKTDANTFLGTPQLHEEVFGPSGLIVEAASDEEIFAVANALEGQLTATMFINTDDAALGAQLLPVLERKAGRVLFNAFPTGVEVCDAMVHGGPYPASTNFGATSVGTMAIRRFLRPVCYQDLPDFLTSDDLKSK